MSSTASTVNAGELQDLNRQFYNRGSTVAESEASKAPALGSCLAGERGPVAACPGNSIHQVTLDGNCSNAIYFDCSGFDAGVATVVTAFWHLRPDRPLDAWVRWLEDVHDLNASLVSFVPKTLAAALRKRRADRGYLRRTCVVGLPTHATLPYCSLLGRVGELIQKLRQDRPARYAGWNWQSPEMTNSNYVLLQAGKVAMLDAVRQQGLSGGGPLVWVDAGLFRHVSKTPQPSGWPAESQLKYLSPGRIYLGSWAGYPPMASAVRAFCEAPGANFVKNRNHLSGGVVIAADGALDVIVPAWTHALERMVATRTWNNEQVLWELLMCFFPQRLGILDYRKVLFEELAAGHGSLKNKVDFRGPDNPGAFCAFWGEHYADGARL